MTTTDGYAYIDDVNIYNDKQHWDNCNIRIHDDNAETKEDSDWPRAWIGEIWDGEKEWTYGFDKELIMPRKLEGHLPSEGRWYTTLVHELGHYVFGFYDEYEIDPDIGDFREYPDLDEYPALDDNALMISNEPYMSYKAQYDISAPITQQLAERGMSCWGWFITAFETDGNSEQKINFQPEAEQYDYRPWGSYERENVPVDVNYDFSHKSKNQPGNNYFTLESKYPPTIDITKTMGINVDAS